MIVRITEDAKADIKEIYIYSYQNFGELQADKYINGLEEKLTGLYSVLISSDYDFVREGLKRSNYQKHAVYYRIEDSQMLVLRVLHQQMDPARHFEN